MLQVMILSPDLALAQSLQYALGKFESDLNVCRVLDRYPDAEELGRILRAHAPDVVFLSFEDPVLAAAAARNLFAGAVGLQVLAVHHAIDSHSLRESMRCGIREFLTPPFETSTISHALGQVLQNLEDRPVTYARTDQMLAFLPSKAGSGATSLALNIAAAFAEREHTFLGDLDLNSGTLRFLLNLNNQLTTAEAVAAAHEMDEKHWPSFLTTLEKLDIVHAGHVNPTARLEPGQLPTLIRFLRRNYRAICLDLSGNLEKYSIEVMQEMHHVVLVCTPEIPSLHLAREKMTFLSKLGLAGSVRVVLNRMTRHPAFSRGQVEDVLEAPVFATFSNDYAAFHHAAGESRPLDPQSPIGQECRAFVEQLSNKPKPQAKGHKFLENFWVHGPETESYPT